MYERERERERELVERREKKNAPLFLLNHFEIFRRRQNQRIFRLTRSMIHAVEYRAEYRGQSQDWKFEGGRAGLVQNLSDGNYPRWLAPLAGIGR